MKCPRCDGSGIAEAIQVSENDCEFIPCEYCEGQGEVQTNEEWFCALSTEEKAETLSNVIRKAWIGYVSKECNVDSWEFWEKWLKEKHNA